MKQDSHSNQPRQPAERFVQALARINRAITEAIDIEGMLSAVLDEMLDIFDCERAALLYPCDPKAPSWSVPMSRWRPDWPGIQPTDGPQPMTDYGADAMKLVLAHDGPVRFDPEVNPLDPENEIVKEHSIRSQIAMALYPNNDHPWQVVLHHCVEPQVYGDDEVLFEVIGHRLADGITNLIAQKQLRESETRLWQAQHMESLGRLAGGIAHDFNNMLGVITGCADLVMDSVEAGSDVHSYMQQVIAATTRASEMVKQILAFSRRKSGKKQVTSLGPIVKEAVNLLSTLPSSITVRHEIAPDVPLVMVDATQVLQVIVNLSTNAHHAMCSKGGELSLLLSPHRIDAAGVALTPEAREGDYAHLVVRDTGAGIPPQILDRIYEPFFTTKEVSEGSGMGLATSHGIVASYGGFMTVESAIGAGSSFHVFLPAAATAEAEPGRQDAQDSEQPPHGQERVLVVDDEPLLLEVASSVLQALGYRVTPFSKGSDALAALEREPDAWDLLITDQTMPGMDGIEVMKAARSLRADLPVVIMTGHSNKLTLDAHGGVEADAVLNKPFRQLGLARVVRQVLDSDPVKNPTST